MSSPRVGNDPTTVEAIRKPDGCAWGPHEIVIGGARQSIAVVCHVGYPPDDAHGYAPMWYARGLWRDASATALGERIMAEWALHQRRLVKAQEAKVMSSRPMSALMRPDDVAYHAGLWWSDMRQRRVCDEQGQPTWTLTFFDYFLWWSSVEMRIRVEMTRADGVWGCSSAWNREEGADDGDAARG